MSARETLENPGHSRDNGPVIAGRDWGDGQQAAWLLGLRAVDGQEADPYRGRRPSVAEPLAGEVPL